MSDTEDARGKKTPYTVGVMSIPYYHNYGTQLQAFALQEAIRGLGYDVEMINFVKGGPAPKPLSSRLVGLLIRPLTIYPRIRRRIAHAAWRRLTEPRRRLTQDFISQRLALNPPKMTEEDQLLSVSGRYDAVVVGSDQIWNPQGHLGEQAFFLTFVRPALRVAYAPSIGVCTVNGDAADWLASGARGINHLSVREASGAEILKDLIGRDVPVVVDPTLLHDDEFWGGIARGSSNKERPYVLCYFLQGDAYAREAAKKFANEKGFRLRVLPFHQVDLQDRLMRKGSEFEVGPLEFLDSFRNASAVFTDSFHGTIFSVVFRRPFAAFRRYDNPVEAGNFSRIEGFLARIGLTSQVASREEVPDLEGISFERAHVELDRWRRQSIEFLKSSLIRATGREGP